MQRFFLLVLGIIATALIPLFPTFSIEIPEDLIFSVQDRTGRHFTLKPSRKEDTKGIMDLQKDHADLTPQDPYVAIVTTETAGIFFDHLYKYCKERGIHVIEKDWVVIEPQTSKIVGNFSYERNEGAVLIHPHYRGNGISVRVTRQIHEYLAKQIGKPDITFTFSEGLDKQESEVTLVEGSYEDFKSKILPFLNIDVTTKYAGFINKVHPTNIGSLRMCLATGLTVQGVHEDKILFAFPPSPEAEDNSLRILVERLVSKEEEERLAAQKEFEQLYPSTETDLSTEATSAASPE